MNHGSNHKRPHYDEHFGIRVVKICQVVVPGSFKPTCLERYPASAAWAVLTFMYQQVLRKYLPVYGTDTLFCKCERLVVFRSLVLSK